MQLNQLLSAWSKGLAHDVFILDIKNDSRLVQAGDLFIAYPGFGTDGRLFIEQAVRAGAVAIAYEPCDLPLSVNLPAHIPCIPVPGLAERLGVIAQRFYGDPGGSLSVIGVTGTNGKTTIAYQLAQAYHLLGQKAAYIGTIGQGTIADLQPLENTTPDALCLQKLLAQYKQQGIQRVCMEVSSHALTQHRVDAIAFDQAIFTNLTLDHLDFHHSMEAYGAAKARLFACKSLKHAIINQDDAYQSMMSAALQTQVKKISYGMHPSCDVQVVNWHSALEGTELKFRSLWGQGQLRLKALGQFNVYNSLAILCSLLANHYPFTQVVELISQLNPAPGRMELVARAPYVFVDFAHTPDALEKVLASLKPLKKKELWVVFGCGGDRDKSKRPMMGEVASRYADKVVITSDNPRNEDPKAIVKEIAKGAAQSKAVVQLVDRKEAIAYALAHAAADDIVLIAGKGHEAYQQLGSVRKRFSDQEVVRELLGS